jgi:hypothetical protein
LYTNATVATNPSTLLGFGTWTSFGAGRVVIGVDAADPTFNTVGATGGSKDSAVVAHTHAATLTGTAASAGAHTHGISDPGHSHTFAAGGGSSGPQSYISIDTNYTTNFGTSASTTGITVNSAGAHSHTVSVSGTTGSTGNSATNGNLQPYITVYMWLRTA